VDESSSPLRLVVLQCCKAYEIVDGFLVGWLVYFVPDSYYSTIFVKNDNWTCVRGGI
jgi:hypothetical protein